MEVGNRVASQKIGPPLVGEIYGFADAGHWARMYGLSFTQWTNLYPNWREKRVAFLYSEVPQRGMTFEEYMTTVEETWVSREMARIDYENENNLSHYFILPEVDLLPIDKVADEN